MSDRVSSASLRSQALDKSILHHLFLPHNLPSSADADYLIEHNYQNEYQLLEYMTEFFKSLDDKLTLPIFSTLMSCIQRWLVIQNPKNHSVTNLQLTIEQLAPGDFLPLYFHAQNARCELFPSAIGGSNMFLKKLHILFKNTDISGPMFVPPVTPVNSSLLRLTLHAGLSDDDVLRIIDTLESIARYHRSDFPYTFSSF